MNLLFFDTEKNWGGVERWMLTIAEHFRQGGHICYFAGRENSLYLTRCAAAGFEILPLKIAGDFGPVNIARIAGFLLRKKIDVIYTNLNKDTRLGGIARKFVRNCILIGHSGLPILPNHKSYEHSYRFLCDGVICPSNDIKELYLSYGWKWMTEDYIEVIHYGINPQPTEFGNRASVLKKHGLPKKGAIIGIFARLVPQKQHIIFLDIAKKVLAMWPDTTFIICGDGPLREDIAEHSKNLGIVDNVYMLGFQEDIMPLYALCDIVLHTSEHEGLPNAILEAMSHGKPVVAFDIGGIVELIPDKSVGFLVPQNDIFQMTQRVEELLLSPELRDAIGSAARKRILDHFTIKQMVDKTEAVTKKLLQRKKEG